MKKLLPLLFVAGLAAGGAIFMTQNNGSVPGVSIAEAQTADGEVELASDMILGDAGAPVTLIEYASYTCPHCATFHKDVFKQLKQNYIDTGKIQFIHREVYFDRFGLWGGMIARCAGDARYYGVADLIYAGQKEWIGSGDPTSILANLKKIGRTAGMTDEQMDACLQDESMAQSMVAAYQTHTQADGINATPSLVIDGEKYSNMSYDDLAAILDEKLAN